MPECNTGFESEATTWHYFTRGQFWEQGVERGAALLTLTPNNPCTESLLPVLPTSSLASMELLSLKGGMLSPRGHHRGSINFEEKTATRPFWALISLNMPKIKGFYTGWSDGGQLLKGNGVAVTH